MILRRKNPDAPYRWQWRLPDGTWTHDLESAEWAWREEAMYRAEHAAHLAEADQLWRRR